MDKDKKQKIEERIKETAKEKDYSYGSRKKVTYVQFIAAFTDILSLGDVKRNVYTDFASSFPEKWKDPIQNALNAGFLDNETAKSIVSIESFITGIHALSIMVHAYHFYYDSQDNQSSQGLKIDESVPYTSRYVHEAKKLGLIRLGAKTEKMKTITWNDVIELFYCFFSNIPETHIEQLADNPVRYAFWGTDRFLEKQPFSSVGVFGTLSSSYNQVPLVGGQYDHMAAVTGGFYSPGSDVHDSFQYKSGLLTFSADFSTINPFIYWYKFDGTNDMLLGTSIFSGRRESQEWNFIDWTKLRWDTVTSKDNKILNSSSYISRDFPAILFKTEGSEWSWQRGTSIPVQYNRISWIDKKQMLRTYTADKSGNLPLEYGMGKPWLLLWREPDAKYNEIIPILIRLEKKPISISTERTIPKIQGLDYDTLNFEFDKPAGYIGVMPLYGITRVRGKRAESWKNDPPSDAVAYANFWSDAMTAFPRSNRESYQVNEVNGNIEIKNEYEYILIEDDWSTKLVFLAPIPPITALARSNGYPAEFNDTPIVYTDTATFYGPYAYSSGKTVRYTIPIQASVNQMLVPASASGSAEVDNLFAYVKRTLTDQDPKDLKAIGADNNYMLRWFARVYPLLNSEEKDVYKDSITKEFFNLFHQEDWVTVVQPTNGNTWLYNNGFGLAGYNWDTEWVLGRMLFQAWETAYFVNSEIIKTHWAQLKGMYAYFRIYWDWAWQGTMTYQTGDLFWHNAVPLVLDGLMSMARMAKMAGDEDLYKDAVYRSSAQATGYYGMWFLTGYLKSQDYIVRDFRTTYSGASTAQRLTVYSDVLEKGPIYWLTEQAGMLYPAEVRLRAYSQGITGSDPLNANRMINDYLFKEIYKLQFSDLSRKYPDVLETISHMTLRSVLYGFDLDLKSSLYSILLPHKADPHEPTAAEVALRSMIPQVWAPVNNVIVNKNEWEAKEQTLLTHMTATSSGEAAYQWAWRRLEDVDINNPIPHPGINPSFVFVNGQKTVFEKTVSGYWQIMIDLAEGKEIVVEVKY